MKKNAVILMFVILFLITIKIASADTIINVPYIVNESATPVDEYSCWLWDECATIEPTPIDEYKCWLWDDCDDDEKDADTVTSQTPTPTYVNPYGCDGQLPGTLCLPTMTPTPHRTRPKIQVE